jgi:hypothetical protein
MSDAPHPWGWTPERRARQAAAFHDWRPWSSATGPKKLLGKSISSRNADRPESIRRQLKEIAAQLKSIKRLVQTVAAKR